MRSRFERAAVITAFCAMSTSAAVRPQFTWQGEVDGIVVLHIHGKKLDIEYRHGLPVQHQKFEFNATLPDSRQDVRLEVREGRGSVRVTEQPRIENDYRAGVTIEDRQDGASLYSIALYWDAERGTFADDPDRRAGRMDRVSWSGHAIGEVVVECRESRCESKPQSGDPVTREQVRFTRDMPVRTMRVYLDQSDGPADFRLLDSPSGENGFTARVLVRTLPGGGDCSFTLSWQRLKKKGKW